MVQDCNLELHVGKQAEASTPLEVGICLLYKEQRGSNRAEVLGVRKIVACIKGNYILERDGSRMDVLPLPASSSDCFVT